MAKKSRPSDPTHKKRKQEQPTDERRRERKRPSAKGASKSDELERKGTYVYVNLLIYQITQITSLSFPL